MSEVLWTRGVDVIALTDYSSRQSVYITCKISSTLFDMSRSLMTAKSIAMTACRCCGGSGSRQQRRCVASSRL
jgi:hypothetical protein